MPPANPAGVTALADLAKPGLKLALCQEQVPCGATAKKVFDKAKLTVKPVTFGADVKAVLTAVQLGEVDAGVVYKTDVQAAGAKVKGIEIPAESNASTSYPIATLAEAPNAAAARAFVDYVLSADGTKVLDRGRLRQPVTGGRGRRRAGPPGDRSGAAARGCRPGRGGGPAPAGRHGTVGP